jgi:hypothetical protein
VEEKGEATEHLLLDDPALACECRPDPLGKRLVESHRDLPKEYSMLLAPGTSTGGVPP